VSTTFTPRTAIGAVPTENLVRGLRPSDYEAGRPIYVVWEITLRCDLGCQHCGSRAGHARPDELDTAECLDVVRQMADLGIREVTLIGGEAYLREDWDLIAKSITDHGMACGITTGARFFTPERIDRAVAAGVRSISVSLDGLERTHDAQRGVRGSFAAATQAARRIGATPMRLATNTQVNRLSMPELPALAELLADLGSKAWQLQLTVPMGRAADRPQLLLQPYELTALFPLLAYVKQQRLDPAGIRLFPGNNLGYFGPYEAALRHLGDQGAHWGGCPAGKYSLGLEADGKIKGCPSLPSNTYSGGTTREVSVAVAVERASELSYVKSRTRADLWGHCRTCYYADVCKAGCTWTSQVFMGRPGNNPYCIHRALELERQGLQERFEQIAEAPGIPFDQGRFVLREEPLGPPTATLSGHSLESITQLDWRSGGLWSDAELEQLLAPTRKKQRLPVLSE
jgi:radical SAM protein with 4Fe4S-binding SPASM domain